MNEKISVICGIALRFRFSVKEWFLAEISCANFQKLLKKVFFCVII